MNKSLLEQLHIRTTLEQKEWNDICDNILARVASEKSFSFTDFCEKEVPLVVAQRLEQIVGEEKTKKLAEIITSIQQQLQNLPVIHLVLAFSPSSQYLDRLITLLRQKTDPQAILSISVQPTIIGGFSLDYQGQFVDTRLQKIVETMTGAPML